MTPAQLKTIGEALYGTNWQSALAREIGVNDRTVRYWADGTRPWSALLPEKLAKLLYAKRESLAALAKQINIGEKK